MTALPDDIFAEFDQRMRTLDYDQVSLSEVPGPGAGGRDLLLPDYLRDVERLNDSEELERSQLVWESVALITEIIDAASATNQSNQPWWSTFPAERLRFKWRVLRAKIRLFQLHVANRWSAEKHRRVHEQVPAPAQDEEREIPVPRSTPIFPTTRRDVPNGGSAPTLNGYPGVGPIVVTWDPGPATRRAPPTGPVAVTWDPGPIDRLDRRPDSPQSRDRAAIAARQGGGHSDEFFFGLPGGGTLRSKLGGGDRRGPAPGVEAFASLLGGPRDTNTYAHGGKLPGPKGPNPGPGKGTATAKDPNPTTRSAAPNPPAHRSTDKDQGFAKTGPVDRDPSSGPTVVGGTTGGAGQSTITVQAPPKAGTTKTGDPGTLQLNDEEVDTDDPYVEEVPNDPKKGGGGSMPNPEDSGGGGEGPRSRRVRLEGPNPENSGRNARNELRVPARLRFASSPNPASRSSNGFGGEDNNAGLGSIGDRVFDPKLFRFRVPGALGDMPSENQNPNPDDTGGGSGGPRAYGGTSRSSLAGPRSYDAYPDPESTGGGGPRGRYNERPNPEDTGSPHGPSARNRSAIGPWSASRNRMI